MLEACAKSTNRACKGARGKSCWSRSSKAQTGRPADLDRHKLPLALLHALLLDFAGSRPGSHDRHLDEGSELRQQGEGVVGHGVDLGAVPIARLAAAGGGAHLRPTPVIG